MDSGRLAQLGEHRPYKPQVIRSSRIPPISIGEADVVPSTRLRIFMSMAMIGIQALKVRSVNPY